MKKGAIKGKGTLIFLGLIFLLVVSVDANSVTITYPSNNTNYSGVTELNYTYSGDLKSCWYSNSSGAWNSTAVNAGTNWTGLTAVEGNTNWTVYCNANLTAAPSGGFPAPNTWAKGVALYSAGNFKINGVNAQLGDQVGVWNPDRGWIGRFTVTTVGWYGFMSTYGPDGTAVNFSVIDNSTNLMYNTTYTYTLSGVTFMFPSIEFNLNVNCSNCTENSSSVAFNVDTTLPIVNITYPINNTNHNINISNLNYTIIETNPDSCWWSNNSGAWNSTKVNAGTNWTDLSSIEGNNTWEVYCNDTFGNLNSTNITFFKDTVYPLISLGTGTENTETNFSRNWIYINTSWTELNFKNITFSLYNDTGLVNRTTFTTAIYLINFTSLIDNNYTYEVNITDTLNNKNSTGIRKITIDDTPPTVNIAFPLDGVTYNYNNISMNYSVSDNLIGLSSCWYTNDTGTNNYSITCNQNFTQNLSTGTYTYIIYANDTLNNTGNTSYTFGVSTTAPAIALDFPSDNKWFNNGTTIYFNFTATDSEGVSTCQLWGNWTGTWHKNYTWVSPTNATMNFTILNLTEGNYIWNVWCNDTTNNGDFSALNKTVGVDTTYSLISYDAETSADRANLSQSNIYVNVTFTEINFANITFNLVNDTTTLYSNTYLAATYEINWTSLADGGYTYYVNITDKANNKNSTVVRQISLDTVPPSLVIAYPENTTYNVSVSDLNYTSNGVSCWYSNSSGVWNSSIVSAGTNWTNISLIEGNNTWTVYCNDSTNNINSSSITFSKDTTSPNVTLNSPAVNYVNDSSISVNVSFNCSATDNHNLSSIRLYLTNRLNQSFSLNQTESVSGVLNYSNWTLNLKNGNYTWNCLAYDFFGNLDWGENRSIMLNLTDIDDDGIPDRADNLNGNISNINHSGFSNFGITINKSLSLTNFSGTPEIWVYDTNTVILNFTYDFSAGNLDLSKVRIIKDTNSILVNLSGQLQEDYNKTISITDNSFDSLCVKDAEISAISAISSGCNGNNETDFTSCLGGNATINGIECIDSGDIIQISNLRNSAVRGTPASSGDTTSSGGGGGGGGGSTGKTYSITENQFTTGYNRILSAGDKIKYLISEEAHYVTVEEVMSDRVKFNITSTLQQATINIGDLKKFDVTGDGYYDLSVKLNSIANTTMADITIQSISEQVIPESETEEDSGVVGTGQVVDDSDVDDGSVSAEKGSLWLWILVILIIVVGLVVYWFVKKKK